MTSKSTAHDQAKWLSRLTFAILIVVLVIVALIEFMGEHASKDSTRDRILATAGVEFAVIAIGFAALNIFMAFFLMQQQAEIRQDAGKENAELVAAIKALSQQIQRRREVYSTVGPVTLFSFGNERQQPHDRPESRPDA